MKEISVTEAINSYLNEKKTIICKRDGWNERIYKYKQEALFKDQYGFCISSDELTSGRWFV